MQNDKSSPGKSPYQGTESDQQLNLLLGEPPLIDIDDKTLQLLTGGIQVPNLLECGSDQAGPSNVKDFSSWLAEVFPDEDQTNEIKNKDRETQDSVVDCSKQQQGIQNPLPSSAECKLADYEENNSNQRRRLGKRGQPMTDAALSKAHREKARRDRLNTYFEQLAEVCDPNSRAPVKSDKLSIVTDAIRVVQQLRVENNQLKQLNKFLEDRVKMLEMSRGHAIYMAAAQLQQQQQQQQVDTTVNNNNNTTAAAVTNTTTTNTVPQQHVIVPVAVPSMAAQMLSIKQEGWMTGVGGAMAGVPSGAMALPVNDTGMPWLPAPDINQDQKLRPPAA